MKHQHQEDDLYQKAYNHSIKLLAKRDYSRYKMKTKLVEKGFRKNLAEDVVDELVTKRFLREELYIESRVKGLIKKGWSYQKVIHHLEQEECFVTVTEIAEILNSSGIDCNQVLLLQIQKKWGSNFLEMDLSHEQRQKKKEKVLRYLVSKGHGFSESKAALENFLSTH